MLRRALAPVVLGLLLASACSSQATDATPSAGDCPVQPLPIVATVDQWGDIVESLAGACGSVTTIIQGSAGDPHDYEPTPADNAAFTEAKLVVMNGLDYDHWASDAIDTLSSAPATVNGGDVVGLESGANPHLWYSPTYVHEIADAISSAMIELSPDASAYFRLRAAAWTQSMQPYDDEVAAIRLQHAGASYGASEPVFAYMADALGLEDRTPTGYATSAANGSEPGAADVAEFDEALRSGEMAVLIFNTQTEGALPAQLRDTAEGSDVPVVEVTESVPAGQPSFVEWQLGQLQALTAALASSASP